nr:MAG TPA: hypothetical protein [Caudoviricetes sp.]
MYVDVTPLTMPGINISNASRITLYHPPFLARVSI